MNLSGINRNRESTSSKTSSSMTEDHEFEKSPNSQKSKNHKKSLQKDTLKKYEFCPSKPEILKKYSEIEKIYQVRGFPTIIYKIHDSDQNVSKILCRLQAIIFLIVHFSNLIFPLK